MRLGPSIATRTALEFVGLDSNHDKLVADPLSGVRCDKRVHADLLAGGVTQVSTIFLIRAAKSVNLTYLQNR